MAGIRTAAVINVGTATLAAFIGAGGLGDPIAAGLALSDTPDDPLRRAAGGGAGAGGGRGAGAVRAGGAAGRRVRGDAGSSLGRWLQVLRPLAFIHPAWIGCRRFAPASSTGLRRMRLHPFRAVRPAPELAARVAAVPYDVVNRAEAAALARGNPYSFLHVGRSDIDLPDERRSATTPGSTPRRREALDRFQADGTLLREAGAVAVPLPPDHGRPGADGRRRLRAHRRLRARHHPEAREDPAGQGRRPHPARADAATPTRSRCS